MSVQFEQQLILMSEKFRIELPTRYKEINQLFELVVNDNKHESLESLKQQLHRLTGAAGTFGLEKISHAALQLNAFLETVIPASLHSLDPNNRQLLLYLNEQLALEMLANSSCSNELREFSPVQNEINNTKRIIIIEDDSHQAERFKLVLSAQGYDVTVYHDAQPELFIGDNCCNNLPDLFLVDMILHDDKNAGAKFIRQLQQQSKKLPPVIFTSVRDDFEARLEAVRAGSSRYLLKPFSDEDLINSVQSLTEKEFPPYRVLIIDDEPLVADFFVTTMTNANIIAEAIYSPFEAIDKVSEFQPELIVMDIIMPGCNGLELAAMIRQQEHYSKLPIVFLSADNSLQNRLSAMSVGVDDFIPKGIEPYQIIASIKSRLNKARIINNLTDKLTIEREKAEKANIAKSRFLSFISHELKTPLHAILGYSNLLKFDALSDSQLEMVDEIHNSGKLQLELIHDLMDIKMIEEGMITLTPYLFSLNELIQNTLNTVKSQTIANNISIKTVIEDKIEIEMDEKRLRQILLNLLSNAIKYNKENGAVTITAEKNDINLTITVKDTGIGMSKQCLANIFSEFERAEAQHSDIEGTGLGLSITKGLVDLMGGTIYVCSELEQGSIFVITFPITNHIPTMSEIL